MDVTAPGGIAPLRGVCLGGCTSVLESQPLAEGEEEHWGCVCVTHVPSLRAWGCMVHIKGLTPAAGGMHTCVLGPAAH